MQAPSEMVVAPVDHRDRDRLNLFSALAADKSITSPSSVLENKVGCPHASLPVDRDHDVGPWSAGEHQPGHPLALQGLVALTARGHAYRLGGRVGDRHNPEQLDTILLAIQPVRDGSKRRRLDGAGLGGCRDGFPDATRWPTEARTLLRTRVMPKRELVIGLYEEAQALNRGAFIQQQSAVAEVYRVTQRRIWQSLGVALATSLGIALLATLYADALKIGFAGSEQKTRKIPETFNISRRGCSRRKKKSAGALLASYTTKSVRR